MSRLLLLALLCAVALPASAIYKCQTGTQITYGDTECANGTSVKLADTVPAQAGGNAQQRLASDKAELNRLTSERRKNEAIEERAQDKSARAAASKRKQCGLLEQRRRWAAEDAATASGKAMAKSQRKAHRAAEKYTLVCGK